MEPCRDCMALEDELFSANGRWVSLVLQQDRMVREGNPAAITLEDAIRRARRRREGMTVRRFSRKTISTISQQGNFEDRPERTLSMRKRQEIQEMLRRVNARNRTRQTTGGRPVG